jgi:RTX calcium-binding nonapeptide repeat (4 copies)
MTISVANFNTSGFTLAADGDTVITLTGGQVYNVGSYGINGTGHYGFAFNNGDWAGYYGIGIGNLSGNSGVTNSIGAHITGYSVGAYIFGNTIINNGGSIDAIYGIYCNGGTPFDVTLYNYGNISGIGASYTGSYGVDTIINKGNMAGSIILASGNDFYDGRGGTVIGAVYGSNGNDVLVGGSGEDKLFDTYDSNWIVGGGGDDTVTIGNYGASNGTTTAWAGEANFGTDNSTNDTLLVEGSGASIFLGGTVFNAASGAVAGWIWGFENATGTFNADSIVGTAGNNILNGGGGADWLVGGGGYDQFVFAAGNTSGSTIADYSRDIIDLHNIDANTATASDDPFAYRTAHTNNTAAEMVFTNYGSGGKFDLYVNADNIIDATVYIAYAAGTTAPTASDFWL